MPGMGGWTLSAKLRGNPALRSTPIIMVSGHALEARQPVERKGLYDAFVVKPFTLPNLVARIGELLRLDFTSDRPASLTDGAQRRPPAAVDLGRLREWASIGYAAGVERELNRLADALDPGDLGALRRRLSEFDMPGILRLIEGIKTDAA